MQLCLLTLSCHWLKQCFWIDSQHSHASLIYAKRSMGSVEVL